MLTKTMKAVISILLSTTSVCLFLGLKGKERKISMVAMLISTVADFFMIDLFKIGSFSTYPGALLFMISHLIYGLGFIRATKRKNYKFKNKGVILGLIIVISSIALLAFLSFRIEEPETIMFFLILIYYALIGFNLICQFSYAVNEKGSRYMLILAMLLFLISDFTIFLNMLNVIPAHNDFVWFTYIPAQLLIILFNSNLKIEK